MSETKDLAITVSQVKVTRRNVSAIYDSDGESLIICGDNRVEIYRDGDLTHVVYCPLVIINHPKQEADERTEE